LCRKLAVQEYILTSVFIIVTTIHGKIKCLIETQEQTQLRQEKVASPYVQHCHLANMSLLSKAMTFPWLSGRVDCVLQQRHCILLNMRLITLTAHVSYICKDNGSFTWLETKEVTPKLWWILLTVWGILDVSGLVPAPIFRWLFIYLFIYSPSIVKLLI
jgi:hypothetical protein